MLTVSASMPSYISVVYMSIPLCEWCPKLGRDAPPLSRTPLRSFDTGPAVSIDSRDSNALEVDVITVHPAA